MLQHRTEAEPRFLLRYSNTSYEEFMPQNCWYWYLTILENGQPVVKGYVLCHCFAKSVKSLQKLHGKFYSKIYLPFEEPV